MQHHSMLRYLENLRSHAHKLASESTASPSFQNHPRLPLFSGHPTVTPEQTAFHQLGAVAGDHAATLMTSVSKWLQFAVALLPHLVCQDCHLALLFYSRASA